MFALQKSKNKASTRQQIDIKAVKDGVLLLSNNRYRVVLHVSSLNFELKSDDEQDAIIDTYESFLNSLGGPIQILIRTREVDMDKYLSDLRERLACETKAIYRKQLQNYNDFIQSLISNNKILTRHFYIIVPYSTHRKTDFELVKEQIGLRVDIASKGLNRLGMQTRELTDLELLELFYSFYSPEQAKIQPLTERALRLVNTSYIQRERMSE